jgi:hypothetical protein
MRGSKSIYGGSNLYYIHLCYILAQYALVCRRAIKPYSIRPML